MCERKRKIYIYLTNYNLQEHKMRKAMNRKKLGHYCVLFFFVYFDGNEEKKKSSSQYNVIALGAWLLERLLV